MRNLTFFKSLQSFLKFPLKENTVHYAILQSIYDLFINVDNDLNLMRLELCLKTATGKWLDYWGGFFSVTRQDDEIDSEYSERIINSLTRPKTTIPSIKQYVVDYLNKEYSTTYYLSDVSITEPYNKLAKYSHKGLLSHDALMLSFDYYRHGVIQIDIPETVTKELINIVNDIKAAGIKVVWGITPIFLIVTGFETANTVYKDYYRHFYFNIPEGSTKTGLVLSNSAFTLMLSETENQWVNQILRTLISADILSNDEADRVTLLSHLYLIQAQINQILENSTGNTIILDEEDRMKYFLILSQSGKLSTSTGNTYIGISQSEVVEETQQSILVDRIIKEIIESYNLTSSDQLSSFNSQLTQTLNSFENFIERSNLLLSGKQKIWVYHTKDIILDVQSSFVPIHPSSLITEKDLMCMISNYTTTSFVPKNEFQTKLITLSQSGKLSSSEGYLYTWSENTIPVTTTHSVTDELITQIMNSDDTSSSELKNIMNILRGKIEEFKSENLIHYNSLQSPIVVTDKIQIQSYVPNTKNWLFDSPMLTLKDVETYYEINTLSDAISLEQELGNEYPAFGDVFQSPIVVTSTPRS